MAATTDDAAARAGGLRASLAGKLHPDGPMLNIVGVADAGSVHTHKWANYLVEHGHHVHLLSYAAVPTRPRGLDPRVSIAAWSLPNLHVKRFWITLRALRRLRAAIRQQRADLVHAHYLGTGAWYAALAGHHPLAVSVMGGGDVLGTSWRPRSIAERLLSPFALRRADLVLCWSKNLARVVLPLLRADSPVEVLVGGVDQTIFTRQDDVLAVRRRLGLEPGDFVILSPRLFWPRQNIETIVRALPEVLSRQPRARLVLIKYRADAYPEHEAQVERLIDDLGVRDAVRSLPQIPNREMPTYYSAADCTVSIPSTDGTPMTVMESLACGTPAVIGDLDDYDPEIFVHGQTVVRVPVADEAGLAAGILALATSRELRERIAHLGRQMAAQRADYQAEMSRLERLYGQLVRRVS
jgi:glycosyltransferase involved in cell wall biosynthesis